MALDFIGLDTTYPCADGEQRKRIHFDGAASPLAAACGIEARDKLLPHYSNSHSHVHTSAKISTLALQWSHDEILSYFNAAPAVYTCVFIGSGSTAALNRLSRGLAQTRPERNIVIVSAMEHHANDLPHRESSNVIFAPLTGDNAELGAVDLTELEAIFDKHKNKINYVAVSAISNVTGISNPIEEIAKLAHKHGAYIIVDGAQQAAHKRVSFAIKNGLEAIDYYILSGHKVYSPGAPGVLIARKDRLIDLPGADSGGGSVDHVSHFEAVKTKQFPDRELSGTPNIIGAYQLANVFHALGKTNDISAQEQQLMSLLIDGIKARKNLTLYGDHHLPRIGAVSINHSEIEHGLLSAILNDYFSIAVRNECFCAHPYVSEMLKPELWNLDLEKVEPQEQEAFINRYRGMVRISLSLYNTEKDIEALFTA